MAEQLIFDLPHRTARGKENYFVSPANAMAVVQVEDWRNWPSGKMILVGPEASGKTHLATVWADQTGGHMIDARDVIDADIPALVAHPALIVENADRIAGDRGAEEALFHLHNLALAEARPLLLSARSAPMQWGLTLPDLLSRMSATATATLGAPDDALLAALLVKQFADRQLTVPPRLIPYLAGRMERSFAAVKTVVNALDAAALSTGRKIGERLAAEVLENAFPDA